MIESRYWKEDLVKHAKSLEPVKKPKRWSEKRQVNFEKEIIVSFFKIRKLFEAKKVSGASNEYKAAIFRYPVGLKKVNNINYWDIHEIYDLTRKSKVEKNIVFICNQLIHGGATFAFQNKDRNWGGIYTCSDFERGKYIYQIPINEIITILNLVGKDYPNQLTYSFSEEQDDYKIETD
jgi:hypothetical protein